MIFRIYLAMKVKVITKDYSFVFVFLSDDHDIMSPDQNKCLCIKRIKVLLFFSSNEIDIFLISLIPRRDFNPHPAEGIPGFSNDVENPSHDTEKAKENKSLVETEYAEKNKRVSHIIIKAPRFTVHSKIYPQNERLES